MRWFSWLKPKKFVVIITSLGLLAAMAVNIKRGIAETEKLNKEPIIQLMHSNTDEFIMMISNAELAIETKDDIGILESYQEFLKKKPYFEDSLFSEKKIDSLVEEGGITSGERQILEHMKIQFDKTFVLIRAEAEKIQEGMKSNTKIK